MQDPTLELVPPGEPDASAANGFPDPGALFNYVSPTAWINAIIVSLTDFDPVGYCTEWIGGDWGAFYQFGDAMINLSRSVEQVAINVQEGTLKLDADWDGNANDAAYNYFTSLATAGSNLSTALANVGEKYHKAANGAWGLANQLGNLIQNLVDSAILASVIAVGSTALTSTGVGAIVGGAGYVALALIVADMLQLINTISTIINTAMMVIFGSFGMGMDIAYQGGDLSGIQFPSTPYAGPGV